MRWITERRTIRFVSVPQQIARCSVPGKGLGHLAGKPVLRGILGDLEVNNPFAVEAEHNQGVEEPNVAVATTNMSIAAMSGRWLRRKVRQVGEGTLGRHGIHRRTVAWLILMPRLEQFPVDAGHPPQRVGFAHGRINDGFLCRSWVVPDEGGIATANRAGSPCDAIGPRLLT